MMLLARNAKSCVATAEWDISMIIAMAISKVPPSSPNPLTNVNSSSGLFRKRFASSTSTSRVLPARQAFRVKY
jgi:hypothetical protein